MNSRKLGMARHHLGDWLGLTSCFPSLVLGTEQPEMEALSRASRAGGSWAAFHCSLALTSQGHGITTQCFELLVGRGKSRSLTGLVKGGWRTKGKC